MRKFLPHFLIGLFLLATVGSFIYLIQLKWSWPLTDLFVAPDKLEPKAMIAQLFLFSNAGMAFVCGGILAVVSVLLQQVVKNNLASDTTLAVGNGALFAMVLGLLFFPSWAIHGSFWVAFIGALVALGVVIVIALPSKLDPLVMVLAGFVISIFLTGAISLLMLFDTQFYSVLTLWSSGIIYQVNWQAFTQLAIVSVVTVPILIGLHKPLTVMSLNDDQASRLGLPVNWIRCAVFILCAVLTALVVSKVGLIGFVGLGAATAVNALQLRHIQTRLLVGYIIGGSLLALTSNLIHIFSHYVALPLPLPAGAMTGLLGAPLVIWLILHQRKRAQVVEPYDIVLQRHAIDWWLYITPLVTLFILALVFVQNSSGWGFSFNLDYIASFRFGRSLGAAATGILLAVAGVILQQMTRNPMASPEVLGISSAASISMVLAYLFLPTLPIIGVMGFGILGGLVILIFILWLMRKVHNSYLLLIGIAIGSLASAFSVIIGFSNDPRLQTILSWLSGTTYHLHPQSAYILLGLAILSVLISLLTVKPLKLLSLSEPIARGRGLTTKATQAVLLIFVAVLSTITTIAVGPLSFIGLMVPQLARSLGAVQIEKQLPLSALLGALVMLIADWVGRYIIFPYEIPAGILASVIGGGYFLFMMRKFR